MTTPFTRAEAPFDPASNAETGKFVKSLIGYSENIARVGLHLPIFETEAEAAVRWVLPGGTPYRDNGEPTGAPPSFEVAQVNHYALRPADSHLVKRDRGRTNHSHHVLGGEYRDKFDRNETENMTIRRHDARASGILAKRKAHPRTTDLVPHVGAEAV